MPQAILEQLNTQETDKLVIDEQEIKDALKSGGFFDKKENIVALAAELKEGETDLEKSLKENLGKAVISIVEAKKINDKNNFGILNPYTPEEIKMIQLRANVQFDDPIDIDGQRITNESSFVRNQTNPYIRRLELGQKFTDLETSLQPLTNDQWKNVLRSYYFVRKYKDFEYNTIRQTGRVFEENVPVEKRKALLQALIQKEANNEEDPEITMDDGSKIKLSEIKSRITEKITTDVEANKKAYLKEITALITEMPTIKKSLDAGKSINDEVVEIQAAITKLVGFAEYDTGYATALKELLTAIADTFPASVIKTNFGEDIEVMMTTKNIETSDEIMTLAEKKLQLQTIIKAGEIYALYLEKTDVAQPKYEGDESDHMLGLKLLKEILKDDKKIKDLRWDELELETTRIFHSYSQSVEAKKGLDAIIAYLLDSTGRNEENIKTKMVEVLTYIRKVDAKDEFLLSYESGDIILSAIETDISECKISKSIDGADKMNKTIENLNTILEDKTIFNEYIEILKTGKITYTTEYTGSNRYGEKGEVTKELFSGDKIIAFLTTYGLPKSGNDEETVALRYELAEYLFKGKNTLEAKATADKKDIKTNIIKEMVTNGTKYIEMEIKLKAKLVTASEAEKITVQGSLTACQNYITMYKDFILNGKTLKFDGVNEISLNDLVEQQYINYKNIMLNKDLEKIGGYYILQGYSDVTNKIKERKERNVLSLTTDEKIIDMIADIKGVGDYYSDKTVNTAVSVTKELVVQIALMAISGGIANIAAKGALLGIQKGAKLVEATQYVTRVARYVNIAKTGGFFASLQAVPELAFFEVLTEGIVFHAVNTTLNETVTTQKFDEMFRTKINPFGSVESAKGYAESVAFMGVMKTFGEFTSGITKSLGAETIKNKILAQTITLPGEVVAMQATSAVVSFTFGKDVDLTTESWLQTIAMVIGLRMSHTGTGKLKEISDMIENKIIGTKGTATINIKSIIKDETGKVISVEYEITDKTGKILDKGTATEAEITNAIKTKATSINKEVNTETKTEEVKTEEKTSEVIENKEFTINDSEIQLSRNTAESVGGVEQYDVTIDGEMGGIIQLTTSPVTKYGADGVEMSYIKFPETAQGKGLAKDFYVQIDKLIQERYGKRLVSSVALKPQTEAVWEGLVRDGAAEKVEGGYRFISKIDNTIEEIKRIADLQKKSYDELTLQDREDMGGITEWTKYIKDNELRKDVKITSDEKITAKEKFEDLTLEEVSSLIESISKMKEKASTTEIKTELSDADRIVRAQELLEIKELTEDQKTAILSAHKVGVDREGAGLYNYTRAEIKEKAEILDKAGFTADQRRVLMENGICGQKTREAIINILDPIKNFLSSGKVDLALSGMEKISPSVEFVATEMPTKLVDSFYAIVDSFTEIYGIASSDFMFFLGQLKVLKDSFVAGVELYTENLLKTNEVEEVIKNAKLPLKKRIMKGWEIIQENGVKADLSLENILIIEKAITEAHNYGSGEKGKNDAPASIYNYTIKQLGRKMYILMDAMQKCGIEYTQAKDIAKVLLQKGICGEIKNDVAEEKTAYREIIDGSIKIRGNTEKIENCNACKISIGESNLEILKVSENLDIQTLVPGMKFQTPYVIIDRALYISSGGNKGYKGLRVNEEVILGRKYQNDRFDFALDKTISGEHIKISYKDGKILIEDLYSLNGTKITTVDGTMTNEIIKGLQEQLDAYDIKRVGLDKIAIIDMKDLFAEDVKNMTSKYPNIEDLYIESIIRSGKIIYKAITGKERITTEIDNLSILNKLSSDVFSQTKSVSPEECLKVRKQDKKNEGKEEQIVYLEENNIPIEEQIVYLNEKNIASKEDVLFLEDVKTNISEENIVYLDESNVSLDETSGDYLDFSKLEYISEGGGSNGGKRYKHLETGKEYFVKSYENVDQSKTEFVTNLIYQELGLGAPKSYMVTSDKGITLATEKVEGSETVDNAIGINEGFVTDCWLANRDGTKPGNLLQGGDGAVYRVDNGGSLFFRARGKNKASFSNAEVTELESLRDKNINWFSHKHFGSITNKEIVVQVKELKTKMTDEKIKELVYKGDISNKDEIVEVLIKRRDWLIENYDVDLSVKSEVKEIEYSEYDKETLEKIEKKESILGRIPTLKWTHRTDFATLKLILESGNILAPAGRGANFRGGLGAGYGDVTIIMKESVENLKPAAKIPEWSGKVPGKDNMVYFRGNEIQGSGMDLKTYSENFGDFAKIRKSKNDDPNVNVPYLMLGENVDVQNIEAIMLPAHTKNDANYTLTKAKIEKLGIKVIETPTSESILEYAGGSIINADNPKRGDYGIKIQNELKILYPESTFEEAAVKYLKYKLILKENNNKSFDEIQHDYNVIADDAGLSRYLHNNTGQYENYVSQKNFTLEQKAYFTYLIQSKYDK